MGESNTMKMLVRVNILAVVIITHFSHAWGESNSVIFNHYQKVDNALALRVSTLAAPLHKARTFRKREAKPVGAIDKNGRLRSWRDWLAAIERGIEEIEEHVWEFVVPTERLQDVLARFLTILIFPA